MGLTQAPFRLLLLSWVLKHVRLPLRVESLISLSPLAFQKLSPVGLQSKVFWDLIFPVLYLQVGSLMWGSDLWGIDPDSTTSLPLYPYHCGSFFMSVVVDLFC